MGNVSWLQLSDIHYNFKGYDTIKMRESLLAFLTDRVKTNPIHFLVVTGDIVYQGNKYSDEIITFINHVLSICGLSSDKLFIVPGNHDLKRSAARTSIINDIQEKDYYPDFDKSYETALLSGQTDFFRFYKKIKKIHGKGKIPFQEDIHVIYEDKMYNIIQLNTALTCGQDGEEGNLKIDLGRLHSTLTKIKNKNGLNIAIGHHSLDCFSEIERNKVLLEFEDSGVNLYLCGHIHNSAISINAEGTVEIATVVCGANIVSDYGKAGCVFFNIDESSLNGYAHYYCWDNINLEWISDNTVNRKAKEGLLPLSLNKAEKYDEEFIELDTDEFRHFIVEFQKEIIKAPIENKQSAEQLQEMIDKIVALDIPEKFKRMKCNQALRKQFNKYAIYFPTIKSVMESPGFTSLESRLMITGTIIENYNRVFDSYDNGNIIFEKIILELYDCYKHSFDISDSRLKMYFRALAFWSINECDIFDDMKG